MCVCGSSHLKYVLISCIAEIQGTMATQLTATPVPDGTSGLVILSELLGTSGKFILFIMGPIDVCRVCRSSPSTVCPSNDCSPP